MHTSDGQVDLKEFGLMAVMTSSHRLFHQLVMLPATDDIGSSPCIATFFLERVGVASCRGVRLAL